MTDEKHLREIVQFLSKKHTCLMLQWLMAPARCQLVLYLDIATPVKDTNEHKWMTFELYKSTMRFSHPNPDT